MNLPHLAPILFAKHIKSKSDKSAIVLCEFPYPPTLPMLLEAAAQSSSALSEQEVKEAFLVSANSLKLYKKATQLNYSIEVTQELKIKEMSIFSFSIKDLADGKFTIYAK
jgi:hypothetical protein